MWFLTGLAVRMGQSLRLHQGGSNISAFDMQMRRRLWWQILLIDGRAAQLAHSPSPILSPGLEFTLPSNLNDADISPSMTGEPIPHEGPTEMLFCLLRYELGKFLNEQGSSLHSPSVSTVEKDRLIDNFEEHIERLYLRFCDSALPLHLMASGGARSAICKMRLMAHHPSQHDTEGSETEKGDIFNWSVKMVEYDVLGQSTELLKKFSWHLNAYFQLDAFVFMLIVLQSEPPGPLVDKAWDLVSETYRYRQFLMDESKDLHKQIRKLTLKSWEVYQLNRARHGLSVCATPQLIQQLLGLTTSKSGEASSSGQSNGTGGVQSQADDNSTNEIGHGDDAATNGLIGPLDSSVASSSYFDRMPPGWDSVLGSDISDWEYWDRLLGEYHPGELA
jgi:Fungal specific transcription factor domain